jgi:hypothetical protein
MKPADRQLANASFRSFFISKNNLLNLILTFLFSKEKLQKKSAPDEDTGAKTVLFAKIFTPPPAGGSEEKFSNAHRLSFAYVLHMVQLEYGIKL